MINVMNITDEIGRRITYLDAAIEGCDGDEWVAFNATIAELQSLQSWIMKGVAQ